MSFWFVMTSLIGVSLMLSVSFLPFQWPIRLAIALVVTVITVLLISNPTVPTLGPDLSWINSPPYKELTLFFVMVLGMGARVLTIAIEERKKSRKRDFPPSLAVDRWDFVYPLLFAVPTFGLLQGQMQSDALSWQAAVLAFQNGFFWQTILKARLK